MAGHFSNDGGESKLNIELNLVPFIDLLSSLVLFLLVTAVWTQISVIPTAVKNPNGAAIATSAPAQNKQLDLRVTDKGYELTWPANVTLPQLIPKHADDYDREALTNMMVSAAKSQDVDGANVSGDEKVEYGAVIEAIDAIKSGGMPSVALRTN